MILAPRPSSTTSPTTRASPVGRAISPSDAETASTSLNSTWPSVPVPTFSTRMTSPGATRYCLPPARMTAYILSPPKLLPRRTRALSRGPEISLLAVLCRASVSHGGRARTVPQIQANPIILACGVEIGQLLAACGGPVPPPVRSVPLILVDETTQPCVAVSSGYNGGH